jgi:hypothetical protein
VAPASQAAHVTTYLDQLDVAITTRLEDPSLTPQQQRALMKGRQMLGRNTRTLSAEAALLGTVANTLKPAETNGAALVEAELIALNRYFSDAQAQYFALQSRASVGSEPPPAPIARQLEKALEALDQSSASSNSMPVRAKALAFALNKLRAGDMLANRLIKAPASLSGEALVLKGRESDRDAVTIDLNANGTYVVPAHGDEPEETGTWGYIRTSANTGTVTLSTAGAMLDLKFTRPNGGNFTGTVGSESVKGRFTIQD